jgi:hypothetical protein
MISGATRGAGGKALGGHLASFSHNENVELIESRGLFSDNIKDQIAELTSMGSHARTKTPIYHLHVDPPKDRPFTAEEFQTYKERIDKEFKLEGRPFCAVKHTKPDGSQHYHIAYLAIEPTGKAIRFDHDYARREKINRIFELERGESLVKGAHNKAVINALEKEGKAEIAQTLRDAGIDQGPKPLAISPTERHQQERTGIQKADIAQSVLLAWQSSDDGKSFLNALKENNLTLAHGQKCDVIIDSTGNTHALSRLLNIATKEQGIEKIDSAQVVDRVANIEIPTVKSFQDFKDSLRASTPEKAPTDKGKSEVSDVGARPTKAPNGGGMAQQAPTQQPQANTPIETLEGPGEPPGPNASPDEIARYRKRLYDYEQKKAQQWLAMQKAMSQAKPPTSTPTGGGTNGQTKEQRHAISQASATLASFIRKPQADNSRLERVESGDNGRSAEGKRDDGVDGKRPERSQPDPVLSTEIRDKQRESVTSVEPAGTQPARKHDDSANSRPVISSVGNIDADRKKVAIARIQERRFARALNKIVKPEKSSLIDKMIRRLKETPTVNSEIKRNVDFIQNKIKAIMDTKPIKDPKDLDRNFQTQKIINKLHDDISDRKKEFSSLASKVESAKMQIPGIVKFLPWKTEAEVKAEKLAERLEALESNISNLNFNDNQKIADAGLMGGHIAFENLKKMQAWERKPEVVQAVQTQELLKKATESALKGDPEMQRLLLENRIKESLELQKKREEAIRKDNDLKNQQRDQKAQSAAAAAPSTPKMR